MTWWRKTFSASVTTVAWMAAAVVLAFMRAFIRAWAISSVAVMPATFVLVLFRQIGGSSVPLPLSLPLSVPIAGFADGARAAARAFPLVPVPAVWMQVVRALLWFQMWQEWRWRAVVGVSPWRCAAAVRAASGTRAVSARVAASVIVTEQIEQFSTYTEQTWPIRNEQSCVLQDTYCRLGERDLDLDRDLERERLALRLFRPNLLSFLRLSKGQG